MLHLNFIHEEFSYKYAYINDKTRDNGYAYGVLTATTQYLNSIDTNKKPYINRWYVLTRLINTDKG
jgi:hypothetical protein